MDTRANSTSLSAKRVWFLDALRILATYGITVLHTSPLLPEHASVTDLPWKIVISISILFRWCVPAFFMISGALFLNPEKPFSTGKLYKKTILRVTTSFLFWSGFYALVHCIIKGKGKWTFLNQLLRGHYHMWYIFAILGLYMLTPLIRKMTENKKLTAYFLALGGVFLFLLPRSLSFLLLLNPPHTDVVASLQSAVSQVNPLPGGYALFYYVLGYFLTAVSMRKGLRRLLALLAPIGWALTAQLTIWQAGMAGASSGQFYDMSSTTVLAMTVGMFLLCQEIFSSFRPGARLARILLTLSACSFGVYLMHPFFMERLQLMLPPSPAALLIGMPLQALLIYMLSLAVSYLLHRIPLISRYIV